MRIIAAISESIAEKDGFVDSETVFVTIFFQSEKFVILTLSDIETG